MSRGLVKGNALFVLVSDLPKIIARTPTPAAPSAEPIQTGDHVHHAPTGETWVVKRVIGDKLEWCGWPPGQAELSDCTLIEKAADVAKRRATPAVAPVAQREREALERIVEWVCYASEEDIHAKPMALQQIGVVARAALATLSTESAVPQEGVKP